MKNKTKRSIILTSLMAIAAAGAVTVGSTYALFTSESKTNIAITAGKVSVVATFNNLKTYSGVELTGDPATDVVKETAEVGVFTNGGTAKIENNELVLDKMTPGDKVGFDLTVKNESDVKAKCRTIIKAAEDNGLFSGLKVTIGEEEFNGLTSVSSIEELEVGSEDKTVHVTIELPSDAGNEYQGKSTKISYAVEAYQGNAAIEEPESYELGLYTSSDLVTFASLANSGKLFKAPYNNYYHFVLMDDIDMKGLEWTPFSIFKGEEYKDGDYNQGLDWLFDGNGHTIKNLTVNKELGSSKGAGFVAIATSMDIKNLTLDGASITASGGWVGGIAGGTLGGTTIENCKVINSEITAKTWLTGDGYDDGDKVGGILGSSNEGGSTIKGCAVKDTTIIGYRDIASLAGHTASGFAIESSVAENVEIKVDNSHDYKNIGETLDSKGYGARNAGQLVGYNAGNIDLSSCTATNVTIAFKD